MDLLVSETGISLMRSRLSISWSEIREQLSQNFNMPSQLLDKYDFLPPEVGMYAW